MAKQTLKYKLGYYSSGDLTDSETESRRWTTIDSQLTGLYSVLGNGVLSGWDIVEDVNNPLWITVTPGKGVINFISVMSGSSIRIGPLLAGTTNYIYVFIDSTSYWSQNVNFQIFTAQTSDGNAIYLGNIVTDSEKILSIDTTVRKNIGLTNTVQEMIKSHRHTGGVMPDQIDLSSEVQGVIGQSNLPEMDASLVKTGKLDSARIPSIDHITGMTNQGSITHPQLDSFVQSLLGAEKTVMGETSLTNFLQLVLALKHQWPEVDEYLVNQLAFIPGISPDSMIDEENTTAVVDKRTSMEGGEHTISGTAAPTKRIFTKTWDSEEEFLEATLSQTVVDGDLIRLQPTEVKVFIEDFSNVSDWKTEIVDLSSSSGIFSTDSVVVQEGVSSGKLDLNQELASNIAFVMRKDFVAQDWSNYNKVVFYIRTSDIQHGDLFFFFEDAVSGSQQSYTAVLLNGEPTIDRDTLEIGWREVYIDISSMTRGAVTAAGIYTSTSSGWDPSKSFTMNIDNMFLTTGNKFVDSGYARFIYDSPISQNFWRIRWDALKPSGSTLKVRTRTSNSIEELETGSLNPAQWSSYSSTSGFIIGNPSGSLKQYLQIEVSMQPSPDQLFSPELKRLYSDSYVSSSQEEIIFDDKDSFESGNNINIDTSTYPGSMVLGGTIDANTTFYGSGGKAIQVDQDMLPMYQISGSAIPRNTSQVISGQPSSFGQTSAVCLGENGTLWIADTDNDRVVQIAKDGSLVRGFYGSFLSEPIDTYGIEESGPGSNTGIINPSAPSETYTTPPVALHSVYNPNKGILSIVFDQPMESVHDAETTFDPQKIFLKAGSTRVYFNKDSSFRLLGLDGTKYDGWKDEKSNKFINQFLFDYHILEIELGQSDYATLNSIVDVAIPSITIASPYEQQMLSSTSATVTFNVSNFTLGGTENNKIRYQVDSGNYFYTQTSSISLSSLSEGKHTVSASLVDGYENPLQNSEASVDGSFVIYLGDFHDPFISISSPIPNQKFTSSPISVSFVVANHPITPSSSHVRYSIDGEAFVAHRTSDPISIQDIDRGEHEVTLFLADEYGDEINNGYHRASTTFFVGTSELADLKVSIEAGAIRGKSREETSAVEATILSVDVADITFVNMYAPLDVHVVSNDLDLYGSVFVAKLRSPSWTYCLGTPPSTSGGSTSTPSLDTDIFGGGFLDGHSVVGYGIEDIRTSSDMENPYLVMSNNASKFSDTKENAKLQLGSVEYHGQGELMMADSIRNRAIITNTDLSTQSTNVAWEYISDKNICDFHLVPQKDILITVEGTTISESDVTIKNGSLVTWRNTGAVPIKILSGVTSPSQFNSDPDLSLYGTIFQSEELLSGEEFAYRFNDVGETSWFAYPAIVSGIVRVSSARVSDKDNYLILENDTSSFLFGSRVIKVDSWGNIVWTFGEGYLANPKDARPMVDDGVIIST